MNALSTLLRDLFGLVLRVLMVLAAGVFMLSLVAATLLGFVGIVAWRALSGRRPVVPSLGDLLREKLGSWPPQAGWPGFGAARGEATPRPDVVDVEVREIPEPRAGTR